MNEFMSTQMPLAIGLFLFSVVIELIIVCNRTVARQVPTNYILLAIFTVCQSFYFAVVTTMYTSSSVIMAAGMTAGMTLALTAYAFTTKRDFTVCGSLFFCLTVGLIMLMLCSVFMTFAEWWHPLVSSLLVVFYGLYLIYDTQLIAGGGTYGLTTDDYIIGALLIYVDIMMLFLELLRLLGENR